MHLDAAFSEIQLHVLLTILPDRQNHELFHDFTFRAIDSHSLLQCIVQEYGNGQLRQRAKGRTHPEYQFISSNLGEPQLIYRTGALFRSQLL